MRTLPLGLEMFRDRNPHRAVGIVVWWIGLRLSFGGRDIVIRQRKGGPWGPDHPDYDEMGL